MLIALALRALSTPDLHPVADLAAALLGVCIVMLPVALRSEPGSTSGVGVTAVTAGLLALGLPAARGASWADVSPLVAGALSVAALTLCLGAIARKLTPVTRNPGTALGWALAAGLVSTASPLWLAGALDQGLPIADALVALNPLTALAIPSGTDFPRSDWFYRHSPLGSYRYAYPPLGALITAYSTVGIALLAMPLRSGPSGGTVSTVSSLPTLKSEVRP